MSIKLTKSSADEVKTLMEEGDMLRVGIQGGGCSGFSYTLEFDNNFDETVDSKTEQHGVTVIVDKKSMLYLDGTTLDFYSGIDKRGFTFNNPQAVKSCGCGSSFAV